MTGLTDTQPVSDRVLHAGIPDVTDARALPDAGFAAEWTSIVLPAGTKEHLLRTAVAGVRLRPAVPFPKLPLHGVLLLTGVPGAKMGNGRTALQDAEATCRRAILLDRQGHTGEALTVWRSLFGGLFPAS